LTDDPVSLFSAARAHSKLHQAADVALSSICVDVKQQQQVDSLLLFFHKHGKHLDSMQLTVVLPRLCQTISLHHLPPHLQLTSLLLDNMRVQLQPGDGFHGVLRPGLPLKQLRLQNCTLLGGARALAAAWQALSLLSGLEVLNISCRADIGEISFPTAVLSQLQQLTCLELQQFDSGSFLVADDTVPALQPLQRLTRLAALSICCRFPYPVTASMLSQSCHLTRLELAFPGVLEPAALAGQTQLRHLAIRSHNSPERVSGLLSQLQHK
jgi:hypothetical protein